MLNQLCMSINEFDRLLNEKFDQHEFAYNHAGWERLEKQLPKNAQRRVIPFSWIKVTGIAAALAITISGVAWYYQLQNKSQNTIATTEHTTSEIHILNKDQQDQNLETANKKNTDPSSTNKNLLIAASSKPNKKQTSVDKKQQPLPQPSTVEHETIEIVQNSAPSVTSDLQQAALIKSDFGNISPQKKLDVAENNTFSENIFEPITKQAGNTFLSVTGGMNFGSMNTGYMAGINAKQKLGRKLFVEGDLAVVNNKANQTFTPAQQQFAVANKAPIDYKEANLLYVQINPTVGYQVMKNVAIGVGADLQQMVNGNDVLVSVNDEVKTMPGTDVGLTGRTEVSLSKRLKAGLLYREGINNFISSNGGYFDRRYLQVQLKFTVVGK